MAIGEDRLIANCCDYFFLCFTSDSRSVCGTWMELKQVLNAVLGLTIYVDIYLMFLKKRINHFSSGGMCIDQKTDAWKSSINRVECKYPYVS